MGVEENLKSLSIHEEENRNPNPNEEEEELEEGEIVGEEDDTTSSSSKKGVAEQSHPLEHAWTFWFDNQSAKSKHAIWGSSMRPIYTFAAVEEFWRFFFFLISFLFSFLFLLFFFLFSFPRLSILSLVGGLFNS